MLALPTTATITRRLTKVPHEARLPTFALAASLAVIGCDGTESVQPDAQPAVASVRVEPARGWVTLGGSLRLVAIPSDGAGDPLTGLQPTWSTSDSTIATVGPTGLVSGRALGSATIAATLEGRRGTARITVDDKGAWLRFTESDEDFPNPDRGLLRNAVFDPNETDFSTAHEPNETLIWVYYTLEDYRDRPIDDAALARISGTFDAARDAGLKILPLFAYNFGTGEPDAPLSRVLEHIAQLEPILQAQSDVIASFLLGFIGAWGEWHSSTNHLTDLDARRAILDATVDALPSHVPLQIRTPRYKAAHYGGPLSEAQAFSGSAAARIGHRNDCFLASDDDLGTYRSSSDEPPSAATIERWKDFVAQEGRFLPVGGETCRPNPPRSLCPVALDELERLHWSWLNRAYNTEVLDSWIAAGCMETIGKRLGYRIVLKEARVPLSAQAGAELEIEVVLSNVGYAAMYRERPVYVVLEADGARYTFPVPSADPRRWEPGVEHLVRAAIVLPVSIPTGTYSLGLWLPDRAASLRERPEYAVRFANRDVWDAASGVNVLTRELEVGGG